MLYALCKAITVSRCTCIFAFCQANARVVYFRLNSASAYSPLTCLDTAEADACKVAQQLSPGTEPAQLLLTLLAHHSCLDQPDKKDRRERKTLSRPYTIKDMHTHSYFEDSPSSESSPSSPLQYHLRPGHAMLCASAIACVLMSLCATVIYVLNFIAEHIA